MSNEAVKTPSEKRSVDPVEVMPPVDITEDSNEFVMHVEVPGANSDSIKLELENGVLSVEAASTLQRNGHPVHFRRTFRLSKAIDLNKISAKTCSGILHITLPKAEHVKTIKIPVA